MPSSLLRIARAALALAVGVSAGCSSKPNLAEVSGVVTGADGQPLPGVTVIFLPDPEKQTNGSRSSGLTDDAGRYTLVYEGTDAKGGVLVGWHRVLVEDTAVENRDPKGPKTPRLNMNYSSASQTPLAFEVKPGSQSYDFQVDH
jgi:hypothetical protein